MPACFSLTDKSTGKVVALAEVDNLMCAHFNEVPHEKNWYMNWYNKFGVEPAVGHSWEKIKEGFNYRDDKKYITIIEWLEANYTVNSWYER